MTISQEEYFQKKPILIKEITELLVNEVASDFVAPAEEESLWGSPVVDSKAVISVSPVIEKHTGVKLKPSWIKPGGYDSVNDAVNSLIEQLELDLKFTI